MPQTDIMCWWVWKITTLHTRWSSVAAYKEFSYKKYRFICVDLKELYCIVYYEHIYSVNEHYSMNSKEK